MVTHEFISYDYGTCAVIFNISAHIKELDFTLTEPFSSKFVHVTVSFILQLAQSLGQLMNKNKDKLSNFNNNCYDISKLVLFCTAPRGENIANGFMMTGDDSWMESGFPSLGVIESDSFLTSLQCCTMAGL